MRGAVSSVLRASALMVLHLATILSYAAPAEAGGLSAPLPATQRMPDCKPLASVDFSMVPDAPTHINAAKLIPATSDKPAYCEVEGYVAPQVGILMRLPVQDWNGRLLEVGCGGFCGSYAFIVNCDDALRSGYACITTDMGHKDPAGTSAEWAYNNPQALIDFAFRATHVTAVAGKAIAESYYGRKPDKAYFSGCSCGGRQALVEAEKFPWDFNGIIVGAPGISYPDILLNFAHRARFLYKNGAPLFDKQSIQFVNDQVVAKCDMNDGVKDGQIGDPRLCKFSPLDYLCKSSQTSACLTRDQLDALVSFYSEQKSTSGDRISERAYFPGAEISGLGIKDNALMKRTFYEGFFKYMALIPNPGPAWKFEQFDLNADYKRLGSIQTLLQADNPDLRAFKAAGGKLIFYHGWADAGPSPLGSVEFYKAIERTMGGRASTQDFLRLFMVPDMDHCGSGKGAWSIDYLSYLEKWVEQGKAPDVMIGAHFATSIMDPIFDKATDPAKAQFTRPVYPYPLRAQYKGKGDPNSASSFKAVSTEY
jgi:hypothetical protein